MAIALRPVTTTIPCDVHLAAQMSDHQWTAFTDRKYPRVAGRCDAMGCESLVGRMTGATAICDQCGDCFTPDRVAA